jgi:hypothetical protein
MGPCCYGRHTNRNKTRKKPIKADLLLRARNGRGIEEGAQRRDSEEEEEVLR